jgi:general stress protein 26
MDSINKNQPEDVRKDLSGPDAVKKIREIVKSAGSCFFCTRHATGESGGARPMNVRRVDDDGSFWFLSSSDSHKNHEIADDATVDLYLQGSPHSDFLHIVGRASVTRDKAVIEELWTPIVNNWFTGGIDDPRVTAIKITPTDGYYWDNKHGDTIAGIKMLIGAAIKTTLDNSQEGKIKP